MEYFRAGFFQLKIPVSKTMLTPIVIRNHDSNKPRFFLEFITSSDTLLRHICCGASERASFLELTLVTIHRMHPAISIIIPKANITHRFYN